MSKENKDKPFYLSPYEKKISEFYQNNKQRQGEEPSAQLDSEIMAMAKQYFKVNHSLLTKHQTLNEHPHNDKGRYNKIKKSWQWPLSLLASVGIVSVLLLTQKNYFIHPNNIVAEDTIILNEPVLSTSSVSATGTLTGVLEVEQSFKLMKIEASSEKADVLLDSELNLMTRKKTSVSQTPRALKDEMLDEFKLEDNIAGTSAMSLSKLSRLAELLKLELDTQNTLEIEANASSIKMQQTLFEQLAQYQKRHVDFKLTEEFLSVLTEIQIQQLMSMPTKAVPEY
ncbi:MAG: hypothetical protein ACI9LE_001614 [Paraglaciecola sp.]|jgi:hypothetical protein